jgi:hypothetical protein
MTLHQLVNKKDDFTYWWYYAIPTERRGMKHILKVPAIWVDPNRLVPPPNTYDTFAWLRWRRNWKVVIPNSIANEHAVRYCGERQQATNWQYADYERYGGRGICSTCFAFATSNRHLIGYEPEDSSPRNITQPQHYIYGTNAPSAWFDTMRKALYGE